MDTSRSQHGQAMIFGLLFMAVVVMSLLILFNQGQLIKNRVQLENAADAAAYSQAKLAARNMNFAAYTNRAMVANEVSIGQMVSLLSWAKHYKNVGAFVKYPAYNFPVAPPSPTTFSNVLEVVTLPYKIMGTAVEAPAKVMTDVWPTAISYFNTGIGFFQQLFTFATTVAQMEMQSEILQGHEDDPSNREIYTPFIGTYFMVQNALLTYLGENFDATHLIDLVEYVDTGDAEAEDLTADFLGGQSDPADLNNLYERNTPSTKSSSDEAVASYQRYAAIVNRNREGFTADRHWNIWATTPDLIPEFSLDFGIVKLTIDLDFSVGFGLKNDGGSAYVANEEIESNSDIEKLGWSAIDVMSFGVEFDVGIYVEIEICILGCSSATLLDLDFTIPIGFPLAGATHQLVSKSTNAKTLLPEWGEIGEQDGIYGGDSDDDVNDGPLDLFHAQTLLWGQAAPELQPGGMYGARSSTDVSTSYGGPPGYLSLGRNFQESGVTYEYTVAAAKLLEDISTSDNEDTFNIGDDSSSDPDDWDDTEGDIGLTRLDVDTRSRAEGNDVAGIYQRIAWDDSRAMMTLSAAEAYFKNPMQELDGGAEEPASLFSPFWDARLKEPSAVSLLIATGEVDWDELFGSMPDDALGLMNWLLDSLAEQMIDDGIDYVKDQIGSPYDTVLEGPLEAAGDAAKDATEDAVDAITDGLGSF
jgi:Putative Flp pilus-assembly TadE/G-like